ncbi:3737_t:CDS:2 [Dentiscutata heterogama]|uniref:3737_t:CDS:1 n=1 Tax=Dentiscutata heterogama TaxID=1316150 RepID=A0ACA9KXE1_9GLOM|nr:3737_t:CDS:2 [Dentiscutata heterogama]
MLCPIRIGMKTLVEHNRHEFFINVLEPNIEDSPSPTYQASCSLVYSEIYMSSSTAITSLYQQLFGTKTKFSGPLVMGFNQSDIVKQLLEDITFQPFEKKYFLYVQSFIANKCNVTIYEESKIKTIVNGITPTDVWSKIDHKPKFDADELFGTNNSYVQKLINDL